MNRRAFLTALGLAPAVATAATLDPGIAPVPPLDNLNEARSHLTAPQCELVNATEREVLLYGGRCFGKSYGVREWATSKRDAVIVMPSFRAANYSLEDAARQIQGSRLQRMTRTLHFRDGGRVRFMTPEEMQDGALLELRPEGIAFDGFTAREWEIAFLDSYEGILERNPLTQFVISVSAPYDYSLLYGRFLGTERGHPDRCAISMRIASNPYVSGEYERILRALEPHPHLTRSINGEWA